MNHRPILLLLLGFLLACNEGILVPEPQPDLVVEAYLYAGRPVENLRLSLPVTLEDSATSGLAVSDAEVWLERSGKRFALVVSDSGAGTYRYPGDDLLLAPGDHLHLEIRYRDRAVSAETTVPAAPRQLRLSADTLMLSRPGFEGPATLDIRWHSMAGAFYSVTVRNIDKSPSLLPNRISAGDGPATIASPPLSGEAYSLPVEDVTHSGRHLVEVFSLTRDYARLFLDGTPGDRSVAILNGNVVNGLGIFTAITPGDSLFFDVR